MTTTHRATYSPDDNKLRMYPAHRLDAEDYARIRAAGFKWAPKQELFVAPMWTPEREDLLIEWCGEIDDEDQTLTERQEERAERFEGYHERRSQDAAQAQRAVSAIADGIPMGQPILVGHHSERRARKDAERIEQGMRRAVKMWDTAQYWTRRAAGAIRHAKYKELPGVRARRIKTIEADKRRIERSIAQAEKMAARWESVFDETRWKAAEDGTRPDLLTRAIYVAKTPPPNWWHLSGELETALIAGTMTPEQARDRVIDSTTGGAWRARAARWIAHFDNRIAYERAMLADQGKAHLLDPKPRRAVALPPLLNYRAPGGIDVQNRYHRGETIHKPQIEMTAAEYAAISHDYKATSISADGTHRVRTCMQRHTLVSVFLTDSKVHERPAGPPEPEPEPPAGPVVDTDPETGEAQPRLPADVGQVRDQECEQPPVAPLPDGFTLTAPAETTHTQPALDLGANIEQLRAALKTGIKVVAAPSLFPTPPDVARAVVALADIRAGHDVLEPSAGTGRLLAAIPRGICGSVVALEINPHLWRMLDADYPDVEVYQRDFLQWNIEADHAFDRIVMNPPFDQGADIKHIQRARAMLKPGGRLVAICADGPRQAAAFKDDAEDWRELPAGTFDGTNVRAAIIVLGAES